jgi:hypothetical protein
MPSFKGPSFITSAGCVSLGDHLKGLAGTGRDAVKVMSVATSRPMLAILIRLIVWRSGSMQV